jgi:lipooligosaccharide transport system permease protein
VGALIAHRDPAGLHGVSYGDFLAPGLLAAGAMQMGTGEATWPVITALRWDRSYHAMLATPITVADVFYGQLFWLATRLTVGAAAFLLAMIVLGFPIGAVGLLALPVAVLTGMACAAPTMAWAIGRKREEAFALHYRLLVMPLFLFSGTFFPIDSLPAGVRLVVQAFPLWHGVELCRSLVLDGSGDMLHVAYLIAATGAGVLAGRRTFAKALAK